MDRKSKMGWGCLIEFHFGSSSRMFILFCICPCESGRKQFLLVASETHTHVSLYFWRIEHLLTAAHILASTYKLRVDFQLPSAVIHSYAAAHFAFRFISARAHPTTLMDECICVRPRYEWGDSFESFRVCSIISGNYRVTALLPISMHLVVQNKDPCAYRKSGGRYWGGRVYVWVSDCIAFRRLVLTWFWMCY